MHKAFGEDELGLGQGLAQHIVLIDRQIIVVPRVDLEEADTAALELELLEPLDDDVGVFAAAAMAHIGQGIGAFPPAGFGVGAAHREDQRRFGLERHHDV